MTANALCRQLKSGETSELTPVVIFFQSGTNGDWIAALQARTDDVLTKPMEHSLMLARLRSLMRARDGAHELDLRDETARALGFAETGGRFNHGVRLAIVAVISNHYDNSKNLIAFL